MTRKQTIQQIIMGVSGLSLIALGPILGGCAAVAVGGLVAGTVAYAKGDLEGDLYGSLYDATLAVNRAAADLHLPIAKTSYDARASSIILQEAPNVRTTIRLTASTASTTHVSIRVGTFGNEPRSRQILGAIEQQLQRPGALSSTAGTYPPSGSQAQ